MSGRGVRSVVLGVALLVGASLGVLAVSSFSPAAATPSGCPTVTDGHLNQSAVYVGQSVTGTVTTNGARRGCPVTISTSSSGYAFCSPSATTDSCGFSVGTKDPGEMTVFAAEVGQTPVAIGTVTVLGNPPPPPPPTTTAAPPPVSSLPPVIVPETSTSAASGASSATTTSGSPTPSAAKPTRINPALKMPDSPWTTGNLPGAAPQATATADPTEAGLPLSNDITHGSGGAGVPVALLLVSVVVLAGVLAAVVRMIVAHTQADAAQ